MENGITIKQWIRLNGREVEVGQCSKCKERVFANRLLHFGQREITELDGTIHACPEWALKC